MKKRFTEEQIIKVLDEFTNGKSAKDLGREYGVQPNTIYTWKRRFGDMSQQEIQKLRSLEDENTKLKRLVAELSLDNMVQKDIIKKYCNTE